jgi:hypothetical protein
MVQEVQSELPDSAAYLPVLHAMQPSALRYENRPAAHGVQATAPPRAL